MGDWVAHGARAQPGLREYEHTPLFEVQRRSGQGGESLFASLLCIRELPRIGGPGTSAPPRGRILRFGEVVSREQTTTRCPGREHGETLTIHYSYDRLHLDAVAVERAGNPLRNLLSDLPDANRSLGELPLLDRFRRDLC